MGREIIQQGRRNIWRPSWPTIITISLPMVQEPLLQLLLLLMERMGLQQPMQLEQQGLELML